MRSAAARAAIRRGSSTRIFRPRSQVSFIKARGTRVVLPAPGGATRTTDAHAAKAVRTSSRTASIGSGGANSISAVSSSHVRFATAACCGHAANGGASPTQLQGEGAKFGATDGMHRRLRALMRMVDEWRARPRSCTARQKKQEERERRQQETPPHPKGNITVLDASENARSR